MAKLYRQFQVDRGCKKIVHFGRWEGDEEDRRETVVHRQAVGCPNGSLSRPKDAAREQQRRTDSLYQDYANKFNKEIGPEELKAICADLGVERGDLRIVMLHWKMKAKKQGYFTKDEWRRALTALQADTIIKLKEAMPKLEEEVLGAIDDFFEYAFLFCLPGKKEIVLDNQSACDLINLVLGSYYKRQVDLFVKFLKSHKEEFRRIDIRQWKNFIKFCQKVVLPNRLTDLDTGMFSGRGWLPLLRSFSEWLKVQEEDEDLEEENEA